MSKDRVVGLFQKQNNKDHPYILIDSQSTHKRVIWAVDISPSCKIFATGSRDKIVKLYEITEGKFQ